MWDCVCMFVCVLREMVAFGVSSFCWSTSLCFLRKFLPLDTVLFFLIVVVVFASAVVIHSLYLSVWCWWLNMLLFLLLEYVYYSLECSLIMLHTRLLCTLFGKRNARITCLCECECLNGCPCVYYMNEYIYLTTTKL